MGIGCSGWTPLLRLGVSCWLLWYPGGGQGQEAAVDLLSTEAEQAIADRVLSVIEAGGRGASVTLHQRRPLELTLDEALQQGLERNPGVLAQQQERVIARQLRVQSEATFDPAINLAAAYTRTDFFERRDFVVRARATRFISRGTTPDGTGNITDQFRDPFVDPESGQTVGEESQPIALTDSFGNLVCVSVDGRLVNPGQCSLQTEVRGAEERASSDADPIEAWTLTAGAAKLFPWGSRLEVEFESAYRLKNFFPLDSLGLLRPLSPDDPIGQGSTFPWASSFSAALNTPLPFSKDFGPYGSVPNIGVLLAKVSERQADWAFKAALNNTLLAVDDAFWELVRNLLQLDIIENQRHILEQRVTRAKRLYETRQITTYDQAQIDTELATIESQEQFAWSAVVTSSNRLAELLDYPADVVLLPARYTGALRQSVTVDEQTAFATARAIRPELNVSRLRLESSRILFQNSQAQTRPDLFLTFSAALSQTDQVLGYKSLGDSLSHVFSPDLSDYFVGVSFRIPIGNREVRSRRAQARLRRDQARDEVQQTENGVAQEINTVIAAIHSTRAQIAESEASLQYAEVAYDKAVGLRDQGLITEFELLQKLSDLLVSRAAYINALVDHRKTRAQLLAAQGVLAGQSSRRPTNAAR